MGADDEANASCSRPLEHVELGADVLEIGPGPRRQPPRSRRAGRPPHRRRDRRRQRPPAAIQAGATGPDVLHADGAGNLPLPDGSFGLRRLRFG
ncbi:hypothetical protein ACRAWF_33840 [Streptomyces sp. L7]